MKTLLTTTLAVIITATVFAQSQTPATPAPAAPANNNFDKNHPRRAEVNKRLDNQNARVDKKVDDGKMSKAEATKIHKEDHAIRTEEKADAATHNGHITKQEQKQINHQENHVSKQIKNH